MRILILLISCFIISSCALFTPAKPAAKTYVLNQIPIVPTAPRTSNILLISAPEARPIYNSTRMVYSQKPKQISYYSENEWAETPPQMLQSLLVVTLQKTNHFKAVLTPPYLGNYDYTLNTEVMQLRQDFTVCPVMMRVRVRVEVYKTSTNQLMGTREFSAKAPSPCRTAYGGVIAANKAMADVLQQIAAYVISVT